ncbi:MAG: hypothetical protein AAGF60_05805 [Pseudomonadota bacterium]
MPDPLLEKLTQLLTLEVAEEDEDALVAEILALSPDPDILSYAFAKEYDGLTPEEIVAKARAYRAIRL